MKHEIPVRHIQVDTETQKQMDVIKDVWKGKNETKETPPKTNDSEEKVVSYTADWKTYAIFVLTVIIVAIFIGYNLRDTTVQDALDNIQFENRNKAYQDKIIDNATISKAKSDASIEKSKESLKKYNILYK